MTLFAKFVADRDRLLDSFDRIKSIDQEDAVVGHRRGVGFECVDLGWKRHDPTVRVSSLDRNSKPLARQQVRGRRTATDVSGATGGNTTIDTLGSSQPEFQHCIIAGCLTDAGGSCCNQRLEVDNVQQHRLDNLALNNRASDSQQRLVWKDDGAFGNRVDVAFQFQLPKVLQKFRWEQRLVIVTRQRRQVLNIRLVKMKVFQQVDHGLQARRDHIATGKRIATKEQMKGGFLVGRAGLPVPISHRQLIQIGK